MYYLKKSINIRQRWILDLWLLFAFLIFWNEMSHAAFFTNGFVSMFINTERSAESIKREPSQINWANEAIPWLVEWRNE